MLSSDDVIQRLKTARNLAEISRRSGIPYGSLRKIVTGETSDPRKSTLDAARLYFERADDLAAAGDQEAA
jgi:predicted transcriptional regulator